jgi:hypothetical protein
LLSSLKRKSAPGWTTIRSAALTGSWNAVQKLDRTSLTQYQVGDMSGYKSTRTAMSDMAKSLERDPQLESLLANRKRELGINIDAGRRLGAELAFSHGIGRGPGLGL